MWVGFQADYYTNQQVLSYLFNEANEQDKANISTLALEELRRIHEGVLARYGLRPSQLEKWKKAQG